MFLYMHFDQLSIVAWLAAAYLLDVYAFYSHNGAMKVIIG